MRRRVLQRIARLPGQFGGPSMLYRFPESEVAPIARQTLGTTDCKAVTSEAYNWLWRRWDEETEKALVDKLLNWRHMTAFQTAEVLDLLLLNGSDDTLDLIASTEGLLTSRGPTTPTGTYGTQAAIALFGILNRKPLSSRGDSPSAWRVLLLIIGTLSGSPAGFDMPMLGLELLAKALEEQRVLRETLKHTRVWNESSKQPGGQADSRPWLTNSNAPWQRVQHELSKQDLSRF